jgi:hypothetical protein
MRWSRGRYGFDVVDEPCYSFGSADNPRRYEHEHLLESEDPLSSKHAVVCVDGDERCGSAVLGASRGPTGIHDHSLVVLDDRCFLAIGDRVACMAIPSLALLWHVSVDWATCFGLHLGGDERYLVVHGELEISS